MVRFSGEPVALWVFLSDEEAGVEGGMAMGLASALGGFKNAKNAKDAKNANPWKLAPLALLGRAWNLLIEAEAGGHTTGWGMGVSGPP